MKTISKILILLLLAIILCGFGYKAYRDNNYETLYFHEYMRKGDTIEGIASKYYNYKFETRSYEEFRYDVMQKNKVHMANGRIPQVGDIICIEVRIRRDK